ncbi:hypothetical protein DVH24_017914 [Malus domestica]|uniref:RNase H type-1 domain-containing protein n=1 Tax=Malus domestica TaxID=3750 RepID=A0A498KJS9_MALDO|nr:hypothetical protein DVH24_017914 [Malus domestica]
MNNFYALTRVLPIVVSFIGGFSLNLGHYTSFYAEFHIVILAVKLSYVQGWQNVWLESDSSSVISCFAYGYFSPHWSLQIRWKNYISWLRHMAFLALIHFEKGI